MSPENPFASLLFEMEERVMANTSLAEEWREEILHFSPLGPSPAMLPRFQQWFLLEHQPSALGTPPAVAWSPPSLEEEDRWSRLLDSFFGIFQASLDAETAILEDLWSGRSIRVSPWPGIDDSPEDSLWIGRFALEGDYVHIPLPGILAVQSPGLVDAVTKDLAAIRARNPRGRISQKECESIFAPFLEAPDDKPTSEVAEQSLATLFADQKGWDLDRLAETVKSEGLASCLDTLAFETSIDLEKVRRLLPIWVQQPSAAPAQDASAEGKVPLRTIQDALEAFDEQRAQGSSLEDAFGDLEAALGLEPGSSDFDPTAEEPRLPQTQKETVDLGHWREAYKWEMEASGKPIDSAEIDCINSLISRCTSLTAADTLAWLMSSETLPRLEEKLARIEPFLAWACREQEAGQEDFLIALQADLGQRIGRIFEFHRLKPQAGRHGGEVVAISPLKIQTEDGKQTLAQMPDESWDDLPRVGDFLRGIFKNQVLEVEALLPAEARPPAVEKP